jgi:DNA polymerase III alpha subunit
MAIKNVGHGIAEEIVEVRTKDGTFKSLNDFIERTAQLKNLNKKGLGGSNQIWSI